MDRVILLTGGSGLFGREFLEYNSKQENPILVHAPGRAELDVTNPDLCGEIVEKTGPNIIVHAAAFTNGRAAQKAPEEACLVNVNGTMNMLFQAMKKEVKFVYISTDHVFDGIAGRYRTDSPMNPKTNYAKTKAAGELLVRTYKNSLVIRTSFFGREFPFEEAFVDQFSSKDYIDKLIPKLYGAICSEQTGIIHVGSERRTLYEIAIERNPNVRAASRTKIKDYNVPYDTSMELGE